MNKPQPLIDITRRQALLFATFLVSYEFLTYVANDMIMPGMLDVVKTFHAPVSMIAYSMTVYVLGGSCLQLILGPISDRYGRRGVMLTGSVIFIVCTCFLALSNSMDAFLWWRFFQGTGMCFIAVVGYAVLQEIFVECDAIRLISIMANVAILAPLLGPLAGAFLLQYISWRWIFGGIALATALTVFGFWLYMPESIGAIRRDGKVIRPASISLSSVLATYRKLLSMRTFMCGIFAYGLGVVPCIVWIAISPVIIVKNANLSLIDYGYWQFPLFASIIVGNILLRYLIVRRSLEQLIQYGSIVMCSGLFCMWLLTYFLQSHFIALMPGLVLYGFGYSLLATPINRWMLNLHPTHTGTVSALICVTNLLLQGLGLTLFNVYYPAYNILNFAGYSAVIGIIYILFICEMQRKILHKC